MLAIAQRLRGACHEVVERLSGGELGQLCAQSFFLGKKFEEMFGLGEMEDVTGSRMRVAGIGELDLKAVGFVSKRKWGLPTSGGVVPLSEGGVGGGLLLDAFERMFGSFRLNDTAGFSFEVKNVVRTASIAREFAESRGSGCDV